MEKIKNYIIIGLTVACIILFIRGCKDVETIEVEVPVKIEVPVPVVEKQFDTIYKPYPVYVKADTVKLTEYIKAPQDKQDSLYADAIAVRDYNTPIEDDHLIGNTYTQVQGKLLKSSFNYKTKPKTISIDTTINQIIEVPYKNKLFIGGELGVPVLSGNLTEDVIRQNIRAEIGAGLDTKKFIFKGSISTDGYGAVGIYYKF